MVNILRYIVQQTYQILGTSIAYQVKGKIYEILFKMN